MFKKSLWLVLLFTVCTLAVAVEIPDTPATKVTEHTYVITGPREMPTPENRGFMNNPAFVITDTSVVVVDPGSSVQIGRMVLRQIKQVTDKPVSHVFNTHVHGDHWLGNEAIIEAYPDAVILAHPRMIEEAKAGAGANWVALMSQLTDGATDGTKVTFPNLTISEGGKLEVGGITFRVHAPPKAHSDTDIMIEVSEDKLVFMGDNATYLRIARMDDGTFRGNINACDVALKLAAHHYVPGHGPTGDQQVVESFRSYLTTLYNEVGKLYAEGLSDFEMKSLVLPKLKSWQDWNGFDDEIGKHISLALLEVEQSEFE